MKTFFQKRAEVFCYAFSGIASAIKTQKNSWIHLFITACVMIIGLILKLSGLHWAILFLCIGMVWLSELMNTAFEALVDLVSPEFNPLAKRCKDIAAGAVLFVAIISIIIGLLIFGPPLYQAIFIR